MNNFEKFGEKYRQEGRQEGLLEGERRFLRNLLEDKFGPLSAEQAAKVAALSDADLDAARKRFITADSVSAVLG